ncbi:cysteine-rich CWC family protein [Roseateles sp.]|uniref:cysteine-rich CWC family protein n=1 Tax=Roseateles sp. TaxID=1971397 RepID=UPI00286A2816|nr:cysteine-rich CWC family protein [Roseateles sp.]
MSSAGQLQADRCPRCGNAFHCGAAEPRCDCFELNLSPALRQQLAQQYAGCLCVACLKSIQLDAESNRATPPAA